jgi:hypothetical protein
MALIHEQLSEQFFRWEERGRGWQVYAEPVRPEPPFRPYYGNFLPFTQVPDSGLKPRIWNQLFSRLFEKPKPAPPPPPEETEPEPTLLVREPLVELQVVLPADLDIARESFEQFFRNLGQCHEPVAFELLGTAKRVLAQFAASAADVPIVRRQLAAHFPDVQFRQKSGTLEKAWEEGTGDQACALEFGLEREFMFPLATGKLDPFIGIIAAQAELQPGELALFQVLMQGTHPEWPESIRRSVTHEDGKPFFVNEPELTHAAENKIAHPLYAVVVRVLVRTATTSRLHEITRELAGALRAFANPQGNALIPLHNDDYPFVKHITDVLRRQSCRSGMILNSDELTGFVHLPSSAVRSPALLRDLGKTKAAPDIVRHPSGKTVVIGDNEHNDETVPVFLTPDLRVRHTHIIGSNGTGKSSLLLNLIRQDIENGDGVAVLDPHGDLIDQLLGCIPADRIKDVVLVDPADVEFPVGFNILQAHSEEEKNLLASDLVGVFRRLATSWGDQMDTVLQNAILVMLDSSRGGTLADLRRFLLEKDFREDFLTSVKDRELLYYWLKMFPQLGGSKSVGSVLTRLQDFFSQKRIRNMVSQRENKLDFEDIMDSGKILLARLSEGLGGHENTYLLGSLLVVKFQQLTMARQKLKQEDRRDFWLYIDEFQHFITPSMAQILTGARKYRMGLTLSHQHLHQLQGDANVASAVMTQPCTRIVLRVGDDDAKKLGEGFTTFDAKSLTRLEQFHAIVRVDQNDFDFNLKLRKPEPPDGSEALKNEIIALSRAKYATPRAVVEDAFFAEIELEKPDAKKATPPEPKAEPSTPETTPEAPARKPRVPKSPPPEPQEPQEPELPKPRLEKAAPAVFPKAPTETDVAEIQKLSPDRIKESRVVTGSEIKVVVAPILPPALPTVPAVVEPVKIAEVPKNPEPPKVAEIPKPDEEEITEDESKRLHEKLKDEIQAEAESLDYTVEPEKVIPGCGQIDLALTRGDQYVACEISDTTPAETEADHIRLRLKAGFKHVAVISNNRRKLNRIQAAYLKQSGNKLTSKVGYYTPKEIFAQLFTWATDDPEGGKVEKSKPRKRVFNFNPSPEQIAKRAETERVMLDDLAKLMNRNKKTA